MLHQKVKNIILIMMFLVCLYLSSRVWLQLPEFLVSEKSQSNGSENKESFEINIWKIVRPEEHIVKYNNQYTVFYTDIDRNFENMALGILKNGLNSFSMESSKVTDGEFLPSDYFKFDFSSTIPIDIFTAELKIENPDAMSNIRGIKSIVIDVGDEKSIYIYNGEKTFKISNDNINANSIVNYVKNFDFSKSTKYSSEQKIGEETINVPVPEQEIMLNPVFVQSEIDVLNDEATNKIAKDYFKSNYDYVRKVTEVTGNSVYMYKNQKVLKMTANGQLDFYDAVIDFENQSSIHESLMTALQFTVDFLGLPENGYLSKVTDVHYDGNSGYRFNISYRIFDRPILFSRVRDDVALQIDVVGNKVVSYKRYIRNVDNNRHDDMQNIKIMTAVDVINKNLESDKNDNAENELKLLKTDMINDISNIYLGYFDLSRMSKEQQLRVVWVIEIGDKSYIFNAITGALIEEW